MATAAAHRAIALFIAFGTRMRRQAQPYCAIYLMAPGVSLSMARTT
jgi:hypothetical protein